jgi:hypothetical protein
MTTGTPYCDTNLRQAFRRVSGSTRNTTINVPYITLPISYITQRGFTLITAAQLRAARALLGMDQRALAHAASLSVPTIQRMEASEGVIRGTVDSLMKLIAAIEVAGVELINEGDTSPIGGRGVRLRERFIVEAVG